MQQGLSSPEPTAASTVDSSHRRTSVISSRLSCNARPFPSSQPHSRSSNTPVQSENGFVPYAYNYVGFEDPNPATPLLSSSRPPNLTPCLSRSQNQPSHPSSPLSDRSGAQYRAGDPASPLSDSSSSPSHSLNLASRPGSPSNRGGPLVHDPSGQDPQGKANYPPGDLDHNTERFQLMQQNLTLYAELLMLKAAYQSLANTVPSLLNNANPPPPKHLSPFIFLPTLPVIPVPAPLQEKDYPLVKFWHRSTWQEYPLTPNPGISGKESASQQDVINSLPVINMMMRYVEDEYGQPVDSHRARAIRQIAHRVFHQLAKLGITPKTWGVAGRSVVKHFNHEMALQVPEMRYCENHWKAGYLAVQLYPQWRKFLLDRLHTMFQPDGDDTSQRVGKRSSGDIDISNTPHNTPRSSRKRVKDRG